MKEIVKVLLAEGIDEETIHEVLNILEVSREAVEKVGDIRFKKARGAKEAAHKLRNSGDIARANAEKRAEKLEDKYEKHAKLYDKWVEGIPTR